VSTPIFATQNPTEGRRWSPGAGVTLYVHVPFCVIKCGYCDFNSYAGTDPAQHDRFLGALDRELSMLRFEEAPPTVFIGGGTPTHLDHRRFVRLLEILARHVPLKDAVEVTIEANPESVEFEKLAAARAAGVNRISIGAQSFDAARLAFLDRAHDAQATREAVSAARRAGFGNLSLDLIFGVPGQDVASWDADLREALSLQPDHLSCYNLTFEAGTRLHRDLRRGAVAPNDELVDRSLFLHTRAELPRHGFDPYEVSNFAGGGGICRHNDHYWLQGDYRGVGPGAAEHIAGVRSTNSKAVAAWASALERGLRPTAEAETLAPRQRAAEAVWLGLRRRDGVDLAAVEQRLGLRVAAMFAPVIDRLLAAQLLRVDGSRLCLTSAAWIVADSVGEAFLAA
jgi:oxygen-independent coproporphyrinogen-3 oxidase